MDGYDNWALAQIQYNYIDEDYQAGRAGLQYAAGKGLAVVVMEPLRGGLLANEPPDAIKALWQTAPVKRSPADWALQWVWNQPEVSLLLSGMSTMPQVEENVECAGRSAPGNLSQDEQDVIARVARGLHVAEPHSLHLLQLLPAVP